MIREKSLIYCTLPVMLKKKYQRFRLLMLRGQFQLLLEPGDWELKRIAYGRSTPPIYF